MDLKRISKNIITPINSISNFNLEIKYSSILLMMRSTPIFDFRSGIFWYSYYFMFHGNKRIPLFENSCFGTFWFHHYPHYIPYGYNFIHWKCLHYNVISIWAIFSYCPRQKDFQKKSLLLHGVHWFIFHHSQHSSFLEFQMERRWIEKRNLLQQDFSICCPYLSACHPEIHFTNTFLNCHQYFYSERGKQFINHV